jgi:hypothetical protein
MTPITAWNGGFFGREFAHAHENMIDTTPPSAGFYWYDRII